jgi:hypothetical protein
VAQEGGDHQFREVEIGRRAGEGVARLDPKPTCPDGIEPAHQNVVMVLLLVWARTKRLKNIYS